MYILQSPSCLGGLAPPSRDVVSRPALLPASVSRGFPTSMSSASGPGKRPALALEPVGTRCGSPTGIASRPQTDSALAGLSLCLAGQPRRLSFAPAGRVRDTDRDRPPSIDKGTRAGTVHEAQPTGWRHRNRFQAPVSARPARPWRCERPPWFYSWIPSQLSSISGNVVSAFPEWATSEPRREHTDAHP